MECVTPPTVAIEGLAFGNDDIRSVISPSLPLWFAVVRFLSAMDYCRTTRQQPEDDYNKIFRYTTPSSVRLFSPGGYAMASNKVVCHETSDRQGLFQKSWYLSLVITSHPLSYPPLERVFPLGRYQTLWRNPLLVVEMKGMME